MLIAAISDIHTDLNAFYIEEIFHSIKNEIAEKNPNMLIFAGDFSHSIRDICNTFEKISDIEIPINFVPGNHDVWLVQDDLIFVSEELGVKNPKLSSWDKYNVWLPLVCQKYGIRFLPNNPVVVDNVALFGSIGWYDYSFKNEKHKIADLKYKSKNYGGMTWNDVVYCSWDTEEQEFTDEDILEVLLNGIQNDLSKIKKELDKRNSIKAFIGAFHHIPFREQVIYKNIPEWDFFSAFMGSEKMGQIIVDFIQSEGYDEIPFWIIHGHTHFPLEFKMTTPNINCFSVPLGMTSETNIFSDFAGREKQEIVDLWIEERLRFIEI